MAQTKFSELSPSSLTTVRTSKADRTIFPITEIRLAGIGVLGEFGTGFCLDTMCRFVATNYHVAMMTRPRKIKGQKVVHQYLATGPADEGSSTNEGESMSPMRFTLSRDLALFELRHPLRKYHGIPFSMDEPQIGQSVDIYSYPKEGINPFRDLLKFQAVFRGETTTGLLAFDYQLSAGKAIRPGASGGIVVDSASQRIVGILNGIDSNGETVALAVPVGTLADFVYKIEPVLAESLFPLHKASIPPTLMDFHSKLAPLPRSHFRLADSAEVRTLRGSAHTLAGRMRNFIAVQTLEWGSGNSLPKQVAAYEVQVIDGSQKFRKYPDGRTEFTRIPYPSLNTYIVPASEWSELPEMVGNGLHVRVVQSENATVEDKQMKVFQYQADIEDSVCAILSRFDFGIFATEKAVTVPCYGEVWTDEDLNILRISEHYETTGKWKELTAVVTYGWLQRLDESPRLIPLTISMWAKHGNTVHWCRSKFLNYKVFSSSIAITSN